MKIQLRLRQVFLIIHTKLMAYAWWEILLFIIGLLSFISILVVLFLPIGNGIGKITVTGEIPAVGTTDFTRMLSRSLNIPIRQGDKVEVINNGDAFLKSLLNDIDGAKASINIMTFIWTDGEMSKQVLAHLNKKLQEGVQVRIMYDAFGSKTITSPDHFKEFTDLGGQVKAFHSFTIVPWQLVKNRKRNHRRAYVIDGEVGYTGGMTVDDLWLGNARNTKEYRDMMFRTTGPMAEDIQGAFGELWTSMTGEVLSGERFYPNVEVMGGKGSLTYTSLMSTPSPDTLAIQKFFLLSILGAHKSIHLTTPYFLPDQILKEALIKKAKEGIDVEILVPNKLNDSSLVYHASHVSYQEFLEAGVKIYEYTPTFIHEKSMVVDGVWSIIGSANHDNLSRKINEEAVFGIESKDFSHEIESNFQADIAKADRIDIKDWKKRSVFLRARERITRAFFQLY